MGMQRTVLKSLHRFSMYTEDGSNKNYIRTLVLSDAYQERAWTALIVLYCCV